MTALKSGRFSFSVAPEPDPNPDLRRLHSTMLDQALLTDF